MAEHTKIVKMLLTKSDDFNVKREHYETILMAAANNEVIETVELLLSEGIDVNAKSKGGWTALMLATNNGHSEIVRLLKQAGARERPSFVIGFEGI